MKAVILSAGWGTRLRPLTLGRPKPAIRLLEETLIEHNLSQLSGVVDEVVIVVGYKEDVIKKRIGERFKKIKITYVRQEEQLGTGHATKTALPFLDEEFLVLNGDDLYLKEDIKKCLKRNPSILVKEVEDPSGYGQIFSEEEKVKLIVEKPLQPISNLINVGCYFLNKKFFEKEIEKSSRGEYEIIDFLKKFIEKENNLYVVRAKNWMPITYPWNILDAAKKVIKEKKELRKGKIERNVSLCGKVIMEEGSVIREGSIIEGSVYLGKNTVVGPGAFVKGFTAVHDNCFIGKGAEIENSVIFSGTQIPHFAFIGDSVIGENCFIGGGTVFANFLFSGEDIYTKVKGKEVNTGRKKMGAVIGNRVKIGSGVCIMPGVTIADGTTIYPCALVKEDLKENTKYE